MKTPETKILFIVQMPPPVHGVTVMNQHAVNSPLWKDNYSVKVLPLHFGQTLEDIGKITIGKLVHMVRFFFRLCAVMVSFRPALVYFTIMPTGKTFYRDAFLAGLIKLFNTKLVYHLHGKGVKEAAQRSSFAGWVYRKTFKGVSVICLSESLKADIESIYNGQPFVLPNGIEANKEAKAGGSNETPVILYLSNLVKSKGIEVLLKSLAELHRQGVPFQARIVGNSADFSIEQAKAFCVDHGLNGVVSVLGPMYGPDKLHQFQQADIFVLPSFNECFPLSILEAMQAGLPVVATAVGGIPDMVVNGQEGMLVKVNDAEDLAVKLKHLLLDAETRKELGAKGKGKFYREYTIDQFHKGLNRVFENILHAQ